MINSVIIDRGEFESWIEAEPIRGNGKMTGRLIDSPIADYISHLTNRPCQMHDKAYRTSPFPEYSSYMLGTRRGDDIEWGSPQPLPEWAVSLNEAFVEEFGHPSHKAEWFFSGHDTLRLLAAV